MRIAYKYLRLLLTVSLLSIVLVACGGGDSGGDPPAEKAKTTWGSMVWGTDCWKDPCQ